MRKTIIALLAAICMTLPTLGATTPTRNRFTLGPLEDDQGKLCSPSTATATAWTMQPCTNGTDTVTDCTSGTLLKVTESTGDRTLIRCINSGSTLDYSAFKQLLGDSATYTTSPSTEVYRGIDISGTVNAAAQPGSGGSELIVNGSFDGSTFNSCSGACGNAGDCINPDHWPIGNQAVLASSCGSQVAGGSGGNCLALPVSSTSIYRAAARNPASNYTKPPAPLGGSFRCGSGGACNGGVDDGSESYFQLSKSTTYTLSFYMKMSSGGETTRNFRVQLSAASSTVPTLEIDSCSGGNSPAYTLLCNSVAGATTVSCSTWSTGDNYITFENVPNDNTWRQYVVTVDTTGVGASSPDPFYSTIYLTEASTAGALNTFNLDDVSLHTASSPISAPLSMYALATDNATLKMTTTGAGDSFTMTNAAGVLATPTVSSATASGSTNTLTNAYGVKAGLTLATSGAGTTTVTNAYGIQATQPSFGSNSWAASFGGDVQIANDQSGNAGALYFMEPSGGANFSSFEAVAQSADVRYQLPPTGPSASSQVLSCTNANPSVCTWVANTATGTVTGSGTTNVITKWLNGAASTLTDSGLTDTGTTITSSENILPASDGSTALGSTTGRWVVHTGDVRSGDNSFGISTNNASAAPTVRIQATTGADRADVQILKSTLSLFSQDSSNKNAFTTLDAQAADVEYGLPTARPTGANQFLTSTAADPSVMSWASLASGGATTGFTADSGTAAPSAGNVNLLGGTNGIDTSASGSTVTFNFDATEVAGSKTWGDGSTDTIVWTWDRSTAGDPAITFGGGNVNVSTGALQEGGVDAVILTKVQSPTNKTLDSGTATTTHAAGADFLQALRHATDCTAITDGKDSELCYEQDSDRLFVCEPTAGGCDTAAEWRLSAAGPTTVTGSGTTNTLTKFTDGPGGVIGDSAITDDGLGSVTVVGSELFMDGARSIFFGTGALRSSMGETGGDFSFGTADTAFSVASRIRVGIGSTFVPVTVENATALTITGDTSTPTAAELRLSEPLGNEYAGFKSPARSANDIWSLPTADSAGFFKSDGSHAMSIATVNLASSTDVGSSILGVANGGTNLSASSDDNVMVGNGTTWQSKAVPDCDDSAGQHLNYDTTTNVWSCGTTDLHVGTVTGLTADAGGTTTGATVTIAGGTNGIDTARSGDTITVNLDTSELFTSNLYTANDTWTKPAGVTFVRVIVYGAGGGGGGGRTDPSGTAKSGGGGGGGGAFHEHLYLASDLSATEAITVGTAGTGGGANTAGNPGGASDFGTRLFAYGGGGGQAGVTGTASISGGSGGGTGSAGATGTTPDGGLPWFGTTTTQIGKGLAGGGAGVSAANATGQAAENGGASGGGGKGADVGLAGGISMQGGGGGGGAGGATALDVGKNGAAGGNVNNYSTTGGGGGAAGTTTDGGNGADGNSTKGGQGGGGGKGKGTTAGGNGGTGGRCGGGGGGGGGGTTGGTGGNGGSGCIYVFAW